MATHHFGAFFARPGREQDYLWGRIDGCCQLVALLIDRLGEDGRASAIDGKAFMRDACVAALEEEWSHVPNARELADAPVEPGHRQAHAMSRRSRMRGFALITLLAAVIAAAASAPEAGADPACTASVGPTWIVKDPVVGWMVGTNSVVGDVRSGVAGRALAAVPGRRRHVARRPARSSTTSTTRR